MRTPAALQSIHRAQVQVLANDVQHSLDDLEAMFYELGELRRMVLQLSDRKRAQIGVQSRDMTK